MPSHNPDIDDLLEDSPADSLPADSSPQARRMEDEEPELIGLEDIQETAMAMARECPRLHLPTLTAPTLSQTALSETFLAVTDRQVILMEISPLTYFLPLSLFPKLIGTFKLGNRDPIGTQLFMK